MVSEVKSNRRWLILGAGLGLLIAIAASIFLDPAATPSGQRSYLENQTAAMRQEFRQDVHRLNTAPRYTLTASVEPEAGTLNGQMTLEYTNRPHKTCPKSSCAFILTPRIFMAADHCPCLGSREVKCPLKRSFQKAGRSCVSFWILNSPLVKR